MSFVDLMGNTVWTENDILNRVRSVTDAQVSPARQGELQTILLGQIAGLRAATPDEMAEILQIKSLVEAAAVEAAAARADMVLLNAVLAYETDTTKFVAPEVLALYLLRNHDTSAAA